MEQLATPIIELRNSLALTRLRGVRPGRNTCPGGTTAITYSSFSASGSSPGEDFRFLLHKLEKFEGGAAGLAGAGFPTDGGLLRDVEEGWKTD